MTLTTVINDRIDPGDGRKVTTGSFDVASTTGGDLDTGMEKVEFIMLQHTESTVVADNPSVNETMTAAAPFDGSAVTCVTTSTKDGIWLAVGY